ncbi:hypothetical protein ACFX13_018793 [Malus domestica]|uniref:Uncharacterized protein n=1 Tax=Malus domestica TaxID=3750 RepID=A0A498HZX3_MALDO|nr:uncharacterized protein LOC103425055 isoform X2 [Malus domestica]RXH75167.1 hypothetical protein DVH24_029888 [Malus domestica]
MEAAPIRIDRKPSIETEPRTLGMEQIEFAREAAKYVVNTKNMEEAMRIFTEGLEPVVSSIQQSGDEVMMASVEEPEYSEPYYRRPRGPREIVSAPF